MDYVEPAPAVDRPVDRLAGMRMSWGGIFGGVLAGLGVLVLLTALGIAIGISAFDPAATEASEIGTSAGWWGAATLLVALFIAGWASTRLAMLWDRTAAMFEGALVWVLSVVLIAYLAASGIGLLAGGAARLLGGAFQGVVSAVDTLNVPDLGAGTADQIVARLRDPQTADRLARLSGMPQPEVRRTLENVAEQVTAARDDPARVAREVRDGVAPLLDRTRDRVADAASRAQPKASAGAWISFGALILSLLAAVLGAALGRRNAIDRAGRVIERTAVPVRR